MTKCQVFREVGSVANARHRHNKLTIEYLKKDVIDYEFSLLLRKSEIDYDDLGLWLKGIKKLNLIRLKKSDSCIDTNISMLSEDEINGIKAVLDKYIDNVVIGD